MPNSAASNSATLRAFRAPCCINTSSNRGAGTARSVWPATRARVASTCAARSNPRSRASWITKSSAAEVDGGGDADDGVDMGRGLAGEAEEKLGVGLGLLQPRDEHLHRLDRAEALHRAAEAVDALQFLGVIDELLLARAGAIDVDRGENAALNESAVEMQLGVAGALELRAAQRLSLMDWPISLLKSKAKNLFPNRFRKRMAWGSIAYTRRQPLMKSPLSVTRAP